MTVADGAARLLGSDVSGASYSARVAREIAAYMGRRGVSQTDLALALGMAQSGMSRRMKGTTAFDVDELAQIADLLGCSVRELLPERAAPGGGVAFLPLKMAMGPSLEGPIGGLCGTRDSNPEPADSQPAARLLTLVPAQRRETPTVTPPAARLRLVRGAAS